MSKNVSAASLVRSDALLADVETACPCGACSYDWVEKANDEEAKCPFWPEQGCHQRKAWQNWKKWTHRILGAMNCFKIACEETQSANNVLTVSGGLEKTNDN